MNRRHQGRCLCGTVTVAVEGELASPTFCHCSQCRRQTGLYYATTAAPLAQVSFTGDAVIGRYRASEDAERGFCTVCGSALFWKRDGDDAISLMAGLFDGPTDLVGGKHIFVGDKGDFYELSDDLPKYAAT